MYLFKIKNFLQNMLFHSKKKLCNGQDIFYSLLLAVCFLLPFQFALSPAKDIDLAIIRIIIPLLFLLYLLFAIKNKTDFSHKNKLSLLLLLFLALATISLLSSSNLFWSLRKLLFLFSIFPIYFLAKNILNT